MKTAKHWSLNLLLVWLALLPWHAFLKTWLSSLFLGSNADFLPAISNVISLWKEIVLAILLILFFFLSKKENLWKQLNQGHWRWLALFAASMLVFAGLQVPNLTALVLGTRTDLLFIPALLLGIFIAQNIEAKETKKIIRITLLSLGIATSLGILAWFIAPSIALNFGYSPYQSSFVENKPLPVYHCLFIDEQCIPRLQATFSGPNQTGSLMILLFGLLIASLNFQAITSSLPLLIPLLGLLLTFSRSAIIGAITGSLLIVPRKLFLIGLVSIIIVFSGIFIFKTDIITHGLSSLEHWEKTTAGITRVIQNPLGTGFGTAGPVSRRLFGEEKALISENWYLQIAEEGGIIPALAFIFWLGIVVYNLFQSEGRLGKTMAFVLLATSIQAFFLHLWEDSVVTMLIWFFVGLAMSHPKSPPNHQDR